MIDFFKEAGMAFIWMFLGYLVGERKDKKIINTCREPR